MKIYFHPVIQEYPKWGHQKPSIDRWMYLSIENWINWKCGHCYNTKKVNALQTLSFEKYASYTNLVFLSV